MAAEQRRSLNQEIRDISKQTTSFLDEILEHKAVNDAIKSSFDNYLYNDYFRSILQFESTSSRNFMVHLLQHCIDNSSDEQLKSIKKEIEEFYEYQNKTKKSIKKDMKMKIMKTKK